MSGHATAESLSLYLDAALPAVERRRVEDHLEGCPECRHRLDGLRRVVAGLARLPAAAPPDDLGARVAREIDLRGRHSRWRRLLGGPLSMPLAGAPPVHLLALVLALGAIVYLFAQGLELRSERPTRIVLPGAGSVVAAPPERVPETLLERSAAGGELYLLGGRFQRAGGVWVETGLAGRVPDERLRVAVAGAAAAAVPELAELAAIGAPLRLRVGAEVVEIAVEIAADPTPPTPG